MLPDLKIIESARFPDTYVIVPFHVEHIHKMSISPVDQKTIDAYEDFDKIVSAYADAFYAFTIFLDHRPVASYLFFNLWPGNWEVTVFKDSGFAMNNPSTFTRCSRRMIEYISKLSFVRRLQITVRNDNYDAMRWARLIGFEYEALLSSYAPDGCDCHIYMRLNHGFHSTSTRS